MSGLRAKLLETDTQSVTYLVSEYRTGGRKPLTRRVVVDRYGVHCKGCVSPRCTHVSEVQRLLRTPR
jgi:hypothetical protein